MRRSPSRHSTYFILLSFVTLSCNEGNPQPQCGNGIIDPGETCDEGALNVGHYGGCTATCQKAAYCGDGIVQPEFGETCDAGDPYNDGTHCNQDCTISQHKPYCGDGIIQPDSEACDDGTLNNTGIYNGCNQDCSRAPYCGDGIIQPDSEACDDGTLNNTGIYNGCNQDCSRAPYCGDGIIQSEFEECELTMNNLSNVPCSETCLYDRTKPTLVIITKDSQLETSEDQAKSVSLAISLTTRPSNAVYVEILSSDETEGTVYPQYLVFTKTDYDVAQTVTVSGMDDDSDDGDIQYQINFIVTSKDASYSNLSVVPLTITNINDDITPTGNYVDIRFMTANLTTGNYQNYDNGDGIRIMKSVSPDIILVQEFNYNAGHRAMTDLVCGTSCTYFVGATYAVGNEIPNGIISRYPLLSTGSEQSPKYDNRGWDWAIIDIPGDKDLLVFSLHLHSKQEKAEFYEMDELARFIKEKASEGDYYLAFGGDFNITYRETAEEAFAGIGVIDASYFPIDQDGNDDTNNNRNKPYDWIVFNKTLNRMEIPITIGTHTYSHGHVIDTRIYDSYHELHLLPGVEANDSNGSQHMAVIRDVRIYTGESSINSSP